MLRKTLVLGGSVLLLLLVLAIAIPYFYRDNLKARAIEEVNKKLNAELQIGDVSVSLFRNFPQLSLTLEDFRLWGKGNFKTDTLLSVKEFGFSMDLWPVLTGGDLSIHRIYAKEGTINLLELRDSSANWRITLPDTGIAAGADTTKAKFSFSIESYDLEKMDVLYRSELSGMKASLNGLEHHGKGDFSQDKFTLVTNTDIPDLNLTYKGIRYFNSLHARAEVPVEVDMVQKRYSFSKNEFWLNDLNVHFQGWLAMPDSAIDMNLDFSTPQSEFKYILSLIPGIYKKNVANLKTSGTFSLKAGIKGKYEDKKSVPSFSLGLVIKDGFFQYPGLPASVRDVRLDLSVLNPDGDPDKTKIALSQFHADLGGNPVDLNLFLDHPVSDPALVANLNCAVDLGQVKRFYPLEQTQNLNGKLKASVKAEGKLNAIKNKNFGKFNLEGEMALSGFAFKSESFPQGVKIDQMQLSLNPATARLESFEGYLGSSDIQVAGYIDNFLFYFLKNEPLKGDFSLKSHRMNLNEFMSKADSTEETPSATENAALKIIEVPANLNFTLNSKIDEVIYDNMNITNLSGSIRIHDQQVGMHDVNLNLLGGAIQTNGIYSTRIKNKPEIQFDLAMQNFDVQQCYRTFVSMRKIAPIAEYTQGKFSTSLKINGYLKEDMSPDLMSFSGGGLLKMRDAGVSGYTPIEKVADLLKIAELKNLVLKDLNLAYEFENGRVFVSPFDIKVKGVNARIYGSNGFDRSIEYVMDMAIPRSKMGDANTALQGLLDQAAKQGVQLDPGQNINVKVNIGGTVDKPEIKTDLKNSLGSAEDALKRQAQQKLDQMKKELENKAKAEAESVKAELEQKRKELEDKARQEADRIKAEAERKAKEEADRIKAEADRKKAELEQKAKDEAAKRLKGLFPR